MSSVIFLPNSRKGINESIKRHLKLPAEDATAENIRLVGVLRAVHLDQDWLEVTVTGEQGEKHIRIEKAGEAIDDVVGPMMNRPVTVDAVRVTSGKYFFKDIQPTE